ncbi:hypothetical protein UFOVP1244_128 [uncultured Caudovirales phage]|uniref:Uncharacterized protein n=1 Tax=uncultured Caudovirales phage TaxID=2100421 RepID=A0A6J5R657_9CAUD|nr:hypothetical protein UFOVP1244_128 [uncultured Caudovirales phage]
MATTSFVYDDAKKKIFYMHPTDDMISAGSRATGLPASIVETVWKAMWESAALSKPDVMV